MRKKLGLAAAVLLAAAGVVSAPLSAGREGAADDQAKALLVNAAGAPVGVVKVTEDEDGVLVRASVHGLAPGFHGFHVHATGACTAPFVSAGGHFNPSGATHGNHAGDMPVLLVNADGTGQLRFATDRFSTADLFDADGSAVIIHAKPDNYANIPTDRYDPDPDAITLATGDAGARVACGVLREGD